MGGEARSPRHSMGYATKLVPSRVNFVSMLSVIFMTLFVPSNDERLLGGSAVTSSPFILAVNDAGIKGIPDILNACMMIGILAISAESVYLASCILRTMAHQRLIPAFVEKVDDKGRPRMALYITCGIAVIRRTSTTQPLIIAFTSYRFHKALKAQNDPLFREPYAWTSDKWPLAPAWLSTISMLILVRCLVAAIKPLSGAKPTALNFFEYMVSIIIIVGSIIIHKVVFRTPWRDPTTADLQYGRRTLSVEEIKQLVEYYSQTKWRRFLTYVQLW